jgi:hypothetical protein
MRKERLQSWRARENTMSSVREEWEERMRRQAEPTAAWARRWNVLPGRLGNHPGVATYSGYAGYVRNGWIPILDRLAEDLIALGWDRTLDQVKQKFGGLRFYIGSSDPVRPSARLVLDLHLAGGLRTVNLYRGSGAVDEAIAHRIAEAEAESLKTCEECGAPGRSCNPGERGWIETLCPRCFAVEDAEVRALRAEEEREQAEIDDRLQAEEDELAKNDPEYRAYLEEFVYPLRIEERRGRPLRPEEIRAAVAACRCGVCGRDLSNETWVAETGETFNREGRCPRCGPLDRPSTE